MTVIQNVSTTSSASLPQQSTTSNVAATEDRFLKLLVTQLKNQDPLNPLDNAQITSQMAQLSTVSGIEKLNATLQSLAASYSATQSMQATSMIGHSVLVPGAAINLQSGAAIAGVEFAQPADKVVISIRDASGNVLQQVDIGAQAAGVAAFQWDGATNNGTAADGAYTFSVNATRGTQTVDASPLTFGQVTAVSPTSLGAMLSIGGLGNVALSDIKQVVK